MIQREAMNVYTFRAITNYDVIIVKKAKKVLTDWCNAKFKSEWLGENHKTFKS